jgi:DNA-binding MarR family transcriptional regulator
VNSGWHRTGQRPADWTILPVVQRSGGRDEAHARLIEILPHLFRRLVIAMPNEVDGLAKVTPEQFGVLNQIIDRGSLSMSELATARNVALNTATSLVDRLVAASLVERRGDPADRRVVRVVVTSRGADLVARLRTVREAAIGRLIDELGDDEIAHILAAMPALARLSGLPEPAEARP